MNTRYTFRGKRLDNGEWTYGYFAMSDPLPFTRITYPIIIDKETNIDYKVIPETIGQCTNLKDKNGKYIFEGDMLGGVYEGLFIKYCEKCKQFQIFTLDDKDYCCSCNSDVHWNEVVEDDGNFEVIGNIHDITELKGDATE